MGVVGLCKVSQTKWNGEKRIGKQIFFKKEGHIEIKLKIKKKTTNLLTITLHVLSSKATFQLTCTLK